jgi:hypothetical protein
LFYVVLSCLQLVNLITHSLHPDGACLFTVNCCC